MAVSNKIPEEITIIVQRGTTTSGTRMEEHKVKVDPGMVVLDAILRLQMKEHDLAIRWNCKAGKCGSCSAEVNGKPRLTCMTKLSDYPKLAQGEPIEIRPMRTFPLIKDLVTDVSWNYEVNKRITPYAHPKNLKDPRMKQKDVERIMEFRKCIECYLCQDVCHILRTHDKKDFAGPRFLLQLANLEMHPLDQGDRLLAVKDEFNIGYCNITKCCEEICPEGISITDNAIIPMKERVVSRFYDPVTIIIRKLFRRK